MTEKHYFADVDLPFHFWVREGGRWVLREAIAPGPTAEKAPSYSRSQPAPTRPSNFAD